MAGTRAAQKLLDMVRESGFHKNLQRVKILTSGNGNLTAFMKVQKEDSNMGGFLHGGMACLLVDDLSTVALMTHPKSNSSSGVSVNINMSYIKAVPIGEEILIKTSTEKVGRRVAFLTVEILNRATGEIVAKGSHTKFIG